MSKYYVANAGNDSNSGLSELLPWEFSPGMSSASGVSDGTTLAAGDFILFNKGDTWRELLTIPTSGSDGSPITFGAYGTGDDPIITGVEVVETWSQYIATNIYSAACNWSAPQVFEDDAGLTYVTWDTNIATTAAAMSAGTWTLDTTGDLVYVWATDNADPDTHTMEVSKRDHCIYAITKNYITYQNLELKGARKSGLLHETLSVGITAQDILSHNNGENSQDMFGWYPMGLEFIGVGNLIVRRCHVYENGWNGMQIKGEATEVTDVVDVLVEDCIFRDETHQGMDIKAGASSSVHNVIIRRNLFFNNAHQGFYIESADPETVYDVTISYNLAYDNGLNGIYINNNDSGGPLPNDIRIYNNVCYGNGINEYGAGINAEMTDGDIKNNICFNNQAGAVYPRELLVVDGGGAVNVCDNNLLYSSTNTIIVQWNGNFWTHAQFVAAGYNVNGLSQDPQFVDAAGDDFHLKNGSPCRNAGVDVGVQSDFDSRQRHLPPEIGAYEIAGKMTPMNYIKYLRK